MATQAAAEQVLFFIPDLGGLTKFIAETETQHSQHIVKELLEILVDANTLGMKVSEFEGDSVLFYGTGAPPLEKIVQQARKMYLDFRTYLKKFEYAPHLPVRRRRQRHHTEDRRAFRRRGHHAHVGRPGKKYPQRCRFRFAFLKQRGRMENDSGSI